MDTSPSNPVQADPLDGQDNSGILFRQGLPAPPSGQDPSPAAQPSELSSWSVSPPAENLPASPSPQPLAVPQTWLDLLDETAIRYSDKIAVSFWDQGLTYRELISSVNRFTALLQHQGIRPGHKIALAVQRSPEMLIALLAILRSGACYIPIDPEYPRPRIEFMLEDSGASLLLVSAQFQDRFRTSIRRIIVEEAWENLPFYTTASPAVTVDRDSLAYIIYTSGSTGRPKGVQVEHHNLLNFLLGMRQLLDMGTSDRLLAVTTISFDIAGLELFLPLISGAELVLADAITSRDARLLYDILREKNISIMQATPSTWKLLLEVGWERPLPLKILCGGEALQIELALRLMVRGKEVWNLYGPTETTIWSTAKRLQDDDQPISIGLPISNTRIYILDDQREPVAEGDIGEIYIAGDGVARGYLGRPDLTDERFLTDPFCIEPGEKMYRTGDIGRILETGDIQCMGRVDHQIKIRGHRVEPAEIEQAILSQQGIRETLVMGKGDQLVAYLVCERKPDPSILRQRLQVCLPGFMIPHHFVVLDKFPLTPNGKIDRQALPEPSWMIGADQSSYAPPLTPTEELLAAIWAEYIGVHKPGRDDDFFESGGNSINALRIMSRLEKETGRRLPLASLFQAPTIAKLSRLVDAADITVSWDPLVTIRPGNSRKPVYIIQGHGMNVITFHNIARHMDPMQPIYGFQARGLNGVDSPLGTIEEMAADYITSILKNDQSDSFCLAGYSYGGIIAFEMARQMKALGRQIQTLAIIDTNVGWTMDTNSAGGKTFRKLRRQWPKMLYIAKGIRTHPWQVLEYQWQYLVGKVRRWGWPFKVNRSSEDLTLLETIDEGYERACRKYRMTPYEGKVDLFRVKTRLYYLDDLEYMGWRSYALEGIAIHEIDGDHKTFMLPPHDRSFAETLQKVLDDSAASQFDLASSQFDSAPSPGWPNEME